MLLAATLGSAALLGYNRSFADWRLEAAARQLVLDLAVARMRTIAESAGHRLRFGAPSAAYEHQREAEPGRYELLGGPRGLPEGVQIVGCTARGSTIGFRPRGHASTFGTVILRGSTGSERRVIVDIAGRARIE